VLGAVTRPWSWQLTPIREAGPSSETPPERARAIRQPLCKQPAGSSSDSVFGSSRGCVGCSVGAGVQVVRTWWIVGAVYVVLRFRCCVVQHSNAGVLCCGHAPRHVGPFVQHSTAPGPAQHADSHPASYHDIDVLDFLNVPL